jgi:nucleotide-binding universal stress UspA family protein
VSESEAMSVRRPLVGFDGSDAAHVALRHAAALARANHGRLTVAFVQNEQPCCVWPLVAVAETPQERQRRELDELRAVIDGLAEDISVVSVVCHGAIGPALVHAARRGDCDAIVIGAPQGALHRLTGGVARYLQGHADVRLIVVARADGTAVVHGEERDAQRSPRGDSAASLRSGFTVRPT